MSFVRSGMSGSIPPLASALESMARYCSVTTWRGLVIAMTRSSYRPANRFSAARASSIRRGVFGSGRSTPDTVWHWMQFNETKVSRPVSASPPGKRNPFPGVSAASSPKSRAKETSRTERGTRQDFFISGVSGESGSRPGDADIETGSTLADHARIVIFPAGTRKPFSSGHRRAGVGGPG